MLKPLSIPPDALRSIGLLGAAAAAGSMECIQRQSERSSLYDWVSLKDIPSLYPFLRS